jgi:hypothetical protein
LGGNIDRTKKYGLLLNQLDFYFEPARLSFSKKKKNFFVKKKTKKNSISTTTLNI